MGINEFLIRRKIDKLTRAECNALDLRSKYLAFILNSPRKYWGKRMRIIALSHSKLKPYPVDIIRMEALAKLKICN